MAVPNQIVTHGFPFGIFTFTYLLTGVAATDDAVAATVGKVVAQDTSSAGAVKLAGDGDKIFGRVYQAENRAVLNMRVASVSRKFKEKVPTAAGYAAPAVGDRVIGGGNGTVKKATANAGAGESDDPIVVEVFAGFVAVEYL